MPKNKIKRQKGHTCLYGDSDCKLCVAPARNSFHKAQWPILSDKLGVHPSQIPEAMAEAKRLGIPTDFDKDGSAIVTSLAHRDKLAAKLGMTDITKREITMPKHRTMLERSLDNSPMTARTAVNGLSRRS